MKPQPADTPPAPPAGNTQAFERALGALEHHLDSLGQALRQRDSGTLLEASRALQQALPAALDSLRHDAPHPLPPELRERLLRDRGRILAQREALSRAHAAVERAVSVLLPGEVAVYGPGGLGRGERRLGSA